MKRADAKWKDKIEIVSKADRLMILAGESCQYLAHVMRTGSSWKKKLEDFRTAEQIALGLATYLGARFTANKAEHLSITAICPINLDQALLGNNTASREISKELFLAFTSGYNYCSYSYRGCDIIIFTERGGDARGIVVMIEDKCFQIHSLFGGEYREQAELAAISFIDLAILHKDGMYDVRQISQEDLNELISYRLEQKGVNSVVKGFLSTRKAG